MLNPELLWFIIAAISLVIIHVRSILLQYKGLGEQGLLKVFLMSMMSGTVLVEGTSIPREPKLRSGSRTSLFGTTGPATNCLSEVYYIDKPRLSLIRS